MNYLDLCITGDISLYEAMEKLNSTERGILFVSCDNVLKAALTDGDIRRFLLAGGKITDSADKAANHKPIVAHSVEEAAKLFDSRNCSAVPIVDDNWVLQNIFIGDKEKVNLPQLNVPVVINAGGKGTRLDPFTRVLPKPLIPIGDLPILELIMQRFISYGCSEFHVIVNHKKELIKSYFNECDTKYNITFYDEEIPLNTGGGLFLLKGKLKRTFFFNNCDTILQSDYQNMLEFHESGGNSITMICAKKNITLPYGIVNTENDVVTSIKEKPELSLLTNTGMYIVNPEVLDIIEDNVPIKFTDVIENERKNGGKVAAYVVHEDQWLDMGEFPELERMRKRIYG